jgi:MoaA/NifB/PqqE/SkfB family radical SAM enzyme
VQLSSLHILLTYQCTLECDHCFVWGSPWQRGTLTHSQIHAILVQAKETGSIASIYFEGGEPFLFYATLLSGVYAAAGMGFQVGIVSNAYWANSAEDARTGLQPFAGHLTDLTLSTDSYHSSEPMAAQVRNALQAAADLGIPAGTICIPEPEASAAQEGTLMYRGRAARKLAGRANRLFPWDEFQRCPYEDLKEPGRVHVDPLGNIHVCQGISIGNLFQQPLKEICARYDPEADPVIGVLLEGGPAALIREYSLPHVPEYADACHACFEARLALRSRFPTILTPDQMYASQS